MKKVIAEMLKGSKYREEPSGSTIELAKANGVVIVYGASDDLMELRGAIDDEVGMYEGGTAYINKDGVIYKPDCCCEYAEDWYDQAAQTAVAIRAVWCEGDYSWQYEVAVPFETFEITEDGDKYCLGIVIDLPK